MNASTQSIFRVVGRKIAPETSSNTFRGSAIYLGGCYAITCFHVLVPDSQNDGRDEARLEDALRQFRFQLLTEDGSPLAELNDVKRARGRDEGDFVLLELKLNADATARPAPMKLLSNVPGEFWGDPDTCEGLHLKDCDRVECWGYLADDQESGVHRQAIDLFGEDDRNVNSPTLLKDWQLTRRSIKEGCGGGAVVALSGEEKACLGMICLGGERGPTSRVIVSNRIIKFLRTVLSSDELEAMLIHATDFQALAVAGWIEKYRQRELRRWNERFYEGRFDTNEQRALFIESQGLNILDSGSDPRQWLNPEDFRSERAGLSTADHPEKFTDRIWGFNDRNVLVHCPDFLRGSDCDWKRLVLTGDAGVGKTTSLRWLATQLNQNPAEQVAILIDPDAWQQIGAADDWLDRLTQLLLIESRKTSGGTQQKRREQRLQRFLGAKRDNGKLVILLDSLDHATSEQIRAIKQLLKSPDWANCRVILGGRPYSLQRYWDELLLPSSDWRFAKAREFKPDEQDRYLGTFPDGTRRYSRVPDEAIPILGVPRVLELLKELDQDDLTETRTASDVYWKAIRRLILRGLSKSESARKLGRNLSQNDQIDLVIELLSAIAFQMTSDDILADRARRGIMGGTVTEKRLEPNFDNVPPSRYEDFRESVWRKVEKSPWYTRKPFQDFLSDLDCLAALNAVLDQGFFDSDTTDGLKWILWRNRSLQEFFTAVWMSRSFTCAEDYADEAGKQLRSWVFYPDDLPSEEYYDIWRFAAEMPEAGRVGKHWVQALGVLYLPGDGTWETRRSNEMLYRSWSTMESYANGVLDTTARERAEQVLTTFQGEFEQIILKGERGQVLQGHAQEFIDSFVEIDGDPAFRMGSPKEKQDQMADDGSDTGWRIWLAEGHDDLAAHINQRLEGIVYPVGEVGELQRAEDYAFWIKMHQNQDLNAIRDALYGLKETPASPVQESGGFRLNHSPTLNRYYRLYDPSHGLRSTEIQSSYGRISGADDCPAINLSWYDGWVFCRWAFWDGHACRLPTELEWEHAAKGGRPWDWNYWWSASEYDGQYCNANYQAGKTLPPVAKRANSFGLRDMLGNVMEWCEDWYRQRYSREATEAGFARVVRGGSWGCEPVNCRSAYRNDFLPSYRDLCVGFRVARTTSRTPKFSPRGTKMLPHRNDLNSRPDAKRR